MLIELSKKAQLVLNKVELELKSGSFTIVDKAQLLIFVDENPSITYLGLLEKVEKYLPTNVDLTEKQLEELIKIYLVWKNLVNRNPSSIAVKMYQDICIKIRLKEITYEKCWYLPLFVRFVKDINPDRYLEFQGWEEVFLIPAIMGQKRINIKEIDTKVIKDFYLKNKLKVKSISKTYSDLKEAAISSREMQWTVMSQDELLEESKKITESNLFGKDIYLGKLKDGFKI